MSDIKCRKCRQVLFSDNILVTNHGISYGDSSGHTSDGADPRVVAAAVEDTATQEIPYEDNDSKDNTREEITPEGIDPEDSVTETADQKLETIAVSGLPVKTRSPLDSCTAKSTVYYVCEELITEWMRGQLDAVEWTKGRLVCPHEGCHQRLGSFDFVNGNRCCRSYQLPNIHIIRSRVDIQMTIAGH